MSLRDNWKTVGKDFAKLGTDFGKTMIKTVKVGAEKADNWANEDVPDEKTSAAQNEEKKD